MPDRVSAQGAAWQQGAARVPVGQSCQIDVRDMGHTPETQSMAAGSEKGLKTCGWDTGQWVIEWGSRWWH